MAAISRPGYDASARLQAKPTVSIAHGPVETYDPVMSNGQAFAMTTNFDRLRPFTIAWTGSVLERTKAQARAYRIPLVPQDAGWRYGCDPIVLDELVSYWLDAFDPAAAADELNRFPSHMVTIEDLDLHVVHIVGEAGGRRPLLLTHGWPGSIYEFWSVIEPLAFPTRHGGKVEDAFDLVIPSLPGFGFSGKPKTPIGARTTARLFDTLMRDVLGYGRYLAQGGDWGAGVSAWLGLDHPDSLLGIHLNYLLVQPDAEAESEAERTWKRAFADAERRLGAYAALQAIRPLSLGYAMADNPVAQLAWLVERFHDWADLRERPFAQVFSKDRLLTNAMLYLLTDAFPTSTWYYAGAIAEGVRLMPKGRRVDVPTAFAAYKDPRSPSPPREWVERGYNITRWRDMPRGGHFAAMEEPDLFVADIRDWARELS